MIKVVTPDEAKRILTEERYSDQRPVSPYWVSFLENEIDHGRFDEGTQLRFAVNGNTRWLIDGYHRLEAVVGTNQEIVFEVTETPVESYADVAPIYARIDQGRKRSFADTFASYGLLESSGMSRLFLNRLASAVKFIDAGFSHQPKRLSLEVLHDLVQEWMEPGQAYWEMISNERSTVVAPFRNYGVMATGLVTLRHSPDMATEFWLGTVQDDGLRKGDPRKALLNFLGGHSVGKTTTNKKTLPTIVHTKYVARAWNHWLNGREIQWLALKDRGISVPIEGTPYEVGPVIT